MVWTSSPWDMPNTREEVREWPKPWRLRCGALQKGTVYLCLRNSSERDEKLGIRDPQDCGSGSVNRETKPSCHGSYGAGQTVYGGEVDSHSFRLKLGPKNLRLQKTRFETKRNYTIAHSPSVSTNTNTHGHMVTMILILLLKTKSVRVL